MTSKLVSATQECGGRAKPTCYDVLDTTDGDDNAIELAHAVSAKVAAELSGIPVALIEDRVVKYGELGVTNFSPGAGFQELEVRLNCDDRGT